ncbi:MAG: histidine phosphatase family protein [Gammaproteobacteria bacterium]|nr:histidine phosphatase family protein [Gammaproteobacteria bacterium]
MQQTRDTVLLIMRHGPAEPAGSRGDAARRLTAAGRTQVQRAARVLAELIPSPQAVWSSPLVRAVETAELLSAAFGLAAPTGTPLLQPGFRPEALLDSLVATGPGPFAVIAHAPDVAGLAQWLIGARGEGGIKFGSGTAALVSFTSPGAGILHALYPLGTFNPTR